MNELPVRVIEELSLLKNNNICKEIDMPAVTNIYVSSKCQIKSTIQKAITERIKNNMLAFQKVAE